MTLLGLGIPVAAILAFATPLGHVPDEGAHVCRADSLLHGAIIGHRERRSGRSTSGVPCNRALLRVITLRERPTDPTPEAFTPALRAQAGAVAWDAAAVFTADGSIGGYMPAFYLPGALAIAAARLSGRSPAAAVFAVRLANLACFALLGASALWITRRGVTTMACALLLPMTLSLAASCSQDGLLVASTALACACLTRTGVAPRAWRTRWFAAAGLLLSLVIASKPPYAPLAGLLWLPLRRDFATRLAASVLVVLPAAAWVALELWRCAVPPLRPPMVAGPLWPGTPGTLFAGPDFAAQWRVLAAHPWGMFVLPWRSIWGSRSSLLHQMIGVLDYLCLSLPAGLYCIWFAALCAAVAADGLATGAEARRGWSSTVTILILVAISITVIGLALYLQWTPVGVPWVGGLEGRYFLLFIPVLALAVPCLCRPRLSAACALVPIAAAAADLVWLPRTVVAFYSWK